MGHSEIGARRPRVNARQQVTGQVEYTADILIPGLLRAKPLLSTEDHARIVRLDTSRAEKLPASGRSPPRKTARTTSPA